MSLATSIFRSLRHAAGFSSRNEAALKIEIKAADDMEKDARVAVCQSAAAICEVADGFAALAQFADGISEEIHGPRH